MPNRGSNANITFCFQITCKKLSSTVGKRNRCSFLLKQTADRFSSGVYGYQFIQVSMTHSYRHILSVQSTLTFLFTTAYSVSVCILVGSLCGRQTAISAIYPGVFTTTSIDILTSLDHFDLIIYDIIMSIGIFLR